METALAEAPEPTGAARLVIDTVARSRLATTHVADHTEPCRRCGKPTTQFALLVTATGHTLCGTRVRRLHRSPPPSLRHLAGRPAPLKRHCRNEAAGEESNVTECE
ncbi:hypothetical protein GCM10009533_54820 [Saccharopolyspora spinosporotrichia]|uniref:Uncharacterized protein n=1 Tax=Saccharopolyspora erythraea TaxID=1836 RepID=A0ABN1DQ14_SACER